MDACVLLATPELIERACRFLAPDATPSYNGVRDQKEVCVPASVTISPTRRRALRRAVSLECAVLSTDWVDIAPLVAVDLSPLGMWLDTELLLEPGSELVVSFRPPHWPAWGAEVTVLAEVVRVGLPRRRGDHGSAGMGLRFLDLDSEHAQRMTRCLLGLPPTLPTVRAQRAERSEEQIVLDDGATFELCAEAPLLTAGRVLEAAPAAAPATKKERTRRRARPQNERGAQRPMPRGARKPALRLAS
jgi:hypothetical protein